MADEISKSKVFSCPSAKFKLNRPCQPWRLNPETLVSRLALGPTEGKTGNSDAMQTNDALQYEAVYN
jgi:hypothetical protein